MTPNLPFFYLARLTLETLTPLSIGTGAADGVFDVELVRDANGLPAIPGSSLAGVLRHLYLQTYGESDKEVDSLFRFQSGDKGEPSRLHVSWGVIQDSQGIPVEGLWLGEKADHLNTDILLKVARATEVPVIRDRVRITHRGAASDQGKFDRSVLPAGYRFSMELSLWSDTANDPGWQNIINLLAHPLFRLGGGGRAGLGKVEVVLAHGGCFDLKNQDDRMAFAGLPTSLALVRGMPEIKPVYKPCSQLVSATLKLQPLNFWRIGQGGSPHLKDTSNKPADLLPKTEQRVVWQDGKGKPAVAELLVPATSVKGALAHRVAFHANRLDGEGKWANENGEIAKYDKSEECKAVRCLFGFARNDRNNTENDEQDPDKKGQAGQLYLDDAFVAFDPGEKTKDLQMMMHNAVDRFTGGVREHFLFSEELVCNKPITLALVIDTHQVEPIARKALRLALDDLCQSRLSLGGGAGKGHGFFKGEIQWSDQGHWINGTNTLEEAA